MTNNYGDPQMITDLNDMYHQLHKSIDEWEALGIKVAENERNYRVQRKLMTLKHKAEGMAIGLIDKTTDGDVAELKMQVDIAEAKYGAAIEHIRVLKMEITSLEERIKREWGAIQ